MVGSHCRRLHCSVDGVIVGPHAPAWSANSIDDASHCHVTSEITDYGAVVQSVLNFLVKFRFADMLSLVATPTTTIRSNVLSQ